MPAPPARTEISNTYPDPSNAVSRIGFGKLWDYVTGLLGVTGNPAEALIALGANGRFAGFSALSSNTALTAADCGQLIAIAASSLTITLPAGSSVPAGGGTYTFATDIPFTIARAGADTIVGPTGTGLTSIVMHGPCSIVWTGAVWRIVLGGNKTLRATAGYLRFGEGPLLQWGSTVSTLSGGSAAAINFPLSFPSACYTVVVCNGDTLTTPIMPGVASFNTTGFNVYFPAAGAISVRTNWQAFGL